MEINMIIQEKTFVEWMKATFTKQELKEMVEHGADAGWNSLTYYKDTCELYNRFKNEIWEAMIQDTDEMGFRNVFALISSFKASDVGSVDQFENLLVWYMAERTARQLTEEQ
jgi:hypothetical protein